MNMATPGTWPDFSTLPSDIHARMAYEMNRIEHNWNTTLVNEDVRGYVRMHAGRLVLSALRHEDGTSTRLDDLMTAFVVAKNTRFRSISDFDQTQTDRRFNRVVHKRPHIVLRQLAYATRDIEELIDRSWREISRFEYIFALIISKPNPWKRVILWELKQFLQRTKNIYYHGTGIFHQDDMEDTQRFMFHHLSSLDTMKVYAMSNALRLMLKRLHKMPGADQRGNVSGLLWDALQAERIVRSWNASLYDWSCFVSRYEVDWWPGHPWDSFEDMREFIKGSTSDAPGWEWCTTVLQWCTTILAYSLPVLLLLALIGSLEEKCGRKD
jgi:hypothetical protein